MIFISSSFNFRDVGLLSGIGNFKGNRKVGQEKLHRCGTALAKIALNY
jgi:hypothetical protein